MTPSVGNFLLLRFPATAGKTAADADRYLSARGFVLRAVAAYGLPDCLRHDGRRRRGEPRRRRGAGGVHGGRTVMSERLGPPLGAPLFDRLALIGVGLIGSSIARAARRKNLARVIAIADDSAEARERATALKLGDEVVADPAEAAAGADLVILCVPVGADEAVARAIAPKLKAGAIVSDVGSVKGAVIAAVGAASARGRRIWCPPIRSPAPSSRARTRASRRCSSTAGAS